MKLSWAIVLPMTLFILFTAQQSIVNAGGDPVIRFAFQDRIGSVIPILALEKDFFNEAGLDVVPLRFSSGPACSEALYSGAAEIGAMGDTTAIILTANSDRFFIIASHATGEHRHRIVVRQNSELRTIHGLKGKKVGVKRGTSTYGGLLKALEKVSLSPAELEIIDLTPLTMTEALLAGSIDAFAASEPTPSGAEEHGAKELSTLGGLGNEYPILILANVQMASKHPETLKAFLRALKKAERYAAEHPQETAAIMSQQTGLPLKTTQRAMERHQYGLRLDKAIEASLKDTAIYLQGQNLIPRLPDFAQAIKSDFLE